MTLQFFSDFFLLNRRDTLSNLSAYQAEVEYGILQLIKVENCYCKQVEIQPQNLCKLKMYFTDYRRVYIYKAQPNVYENFQTLPEYRITDLLKTLLTWCSFLLETFSRYPFTFRIISTLHETQPNVLTLWLLTSLSIIHDFSIPIKIHFLSYSSTMPQNNSSI